MFGEKPTFDSSAAYRLLDQDREALTLASTSLSIKSVVPALVAAIVSVFVHPVFTAAISVSVLPGVLTALVFLSVLGVMHLILNVVEHWHTEQYLFQQFRKTFRLNHRADFPAWVLYDTRLSFLAKPYVARIRLSPAELQAFHTLAREGFAGSLEELTRTVKALM